MCHLQPDDQSLEQQVEEDSEVAGRFQMLRGGLMMPASGTGELRRCCGGLVMPAMGTKGILIL